MTSDQYSDDSISDRLARHGITHEPGSFNRRFLRCEHGPLGMMDAAEAGNLLRLLDDRHDR